MRLASYLGTAAFVGFFAYMAYQKDAAEKAKRAQSTLNTAYGDL